MAKEDIFSKWKLKDYNKELEEILDEKDFSGTVKNLLLSLSYKIETGYQDYATVKRDVIAKKDLMEQVNQKIKENPFTIEINRPTGKQVAGREKIHYEINQNTRKLFVYPNEQSVFNAIDRLAEETIELQQQYKDIQEAIATFLVSGHSMNQIEIIRDFDGWSWSYNTEEIEDITYQMVYQNLRILAGNQFLEDWISNEQYVIDYIELLSQRLIEQYGKKKTEQFLKLFYQVIVLLWFQKKPEMIKKWKEKANKVKDELNTIQNKATYIESLSKQKKEQMKRLNQLEKIMSDKDKLEKEFIKRNEKADDKTKIFSITHLIKVLKKEKNQCIEKIEEITQQMKPKEIAKKEKRLKQQENFLTDLNWDKEKELERKLVELEKCFLRCFQSKIERAEDKKNLLDCIYELRYFCVLPFSKEKKIGEKKELEKEITLTIEQLYKKSKLLKLLINITELDEWNRKIFFPLFSLRMIELEKVEIEMENGKGTVQISYYDGDTIEKTETLLADKNITIRKRKKVKIFG